MLSSFTDVREDDWFVESPHPVFLHCTCTFPMDAKLAEVVPLYKKADKLVMKNYRPVSILPSLSKILEKIIHEQLLPFLEKILDPRMAAYRKMYSCQHVLLRLVEDWKQALETSRCSAPSSSATLWLPRPTISFKHFQVLYSEPL